MLTTVISTFFTGTVTPSGTALMMMGSLPPCVLRMYSHLRAVEGTTRGGGSEHLLSGRTVGSAERDAPFPVEVLHLAQAHVRIDDLLGRVDLLLGHDLLPRNGTTDLSETRREARGRPNGRRAWPVRYRLMMYCSPKNVTSENLPPRDSK